MANEDMGSIGRPSDPQDLKNQLECWIHLSNSRRELYLENEKRIWQIILYYKGSNLWLTK